MADVTFDAALTLELHGALADRFAALGRRRGTRTLIDVPLNGARSLSALMTRLVDDDARFGILFDRANKSLPEHIEVVLNDRVIELQGGLDAELKAGDVLAFLPAHAGG